MKILIILAFVTACAHNSTREVQPADAAFVESKFNDAEIIINKLSEPIVHYSTQNYPNRQGKSAFVDVPKESIIRFIRAARNHIGPPCNSAANLSKQELKAKDKCLLDKIARVKSLSIAMQEHSIKTRNGGYGYPLSIIPNEMSKGYFYERNDVLSRLSMGMPIQALIDKNRQYLEQSCEVLRDVFIKSRVDQSGYTGYEIYVPSAWGDRGYNAVLFVPKSEGAFTSRVRYDKSLYVEKKGTRKVKMASGFNSQVPIYETSKLCKASYVMVHRFSPHSQIFSDIDISSPRYAH